MLTPVKAAVIGCGVISDHYLSNLCNYFMITEVVGCSDLIPSLSAAKAQKYGIRQMTNEEIFSDPEIEIVVNLTYPLSHYQVSKAALLAGKHVYCEKMIAIELCEGEELLALAREKGLLFTVAPDTFLWGGLQTARFAVDAGLIGEPIMISGLCQRSYQLNRSDDAVRMVHQAGGGIPFDMGGYYLHAFVNMLGCIKRATGFAKIRNPHRKYLHPHSPLYKDDYEEVCINTITAVLEFNSGILGNLLITSESAGHGLEKIELIGTEGALLIPDPNRQGEIFLKRSGNAEPCIFPYTHPFTEHQMRGLGVADMAYAIRNGRKPRADAALGLHAFEVIHRVWESESTGKTYDILNRCDRPVALPKTAITGACAECILDW